MNINFSQNASTTVIQENIDDKIPLPFSLPQMKFEVINNFFYDKSISVYTNLRISKESEYLKDTTAMDENFDVISKFEFKHSKKVKGRLKKSAFTPSIVVD